MKIMYLLFSFTTGGTERLVADICNEMADRGHEVHLYVVNDLYSQSMLDTLDGRVRICLQGRRTGGGDKLRTLLTVARYIRENKIEVVHCNSFAAPELLLLKPVAFSRTRVIHTIHDVGQYEQLGKLKCGYRNRLCHRFISISDCVRKDIVDHGAAPDKVVTVYNAINLERFTVRDDCRHPDGQIRIGNVARIMPEKKGQDVLIRAIALLHEKYPQIHCLFAGEADAAHMAHFEALKKMVSDHGLEETVTFVGNVEDVPAFLSALDIFVLPSRYEGFGISLIEAMAMGLPCAASNLDGPAEILRGGRYGVLFECGNEKGLAEQLANMIENLDFYKKEAERAVKAVRELYDIRRMCDSLLSAYL